MATSDRREQAKPQEPKKPGQRQKPDKPQGLAELVRSSDPADLRDLVLRLAAAHPELAGQCRAFLAARRSTPEQAAAQAVFSLWSELDTTWKNWTTTAEVMRSNRRWSAGFSPRSPESWPRSRASHGVLRVEPGKPRPLRHPKGVRPQGSRRSQDAPVMAGHPQAAGGVAGIRPAGESAKPPPSRVSGGVRPRGPRLAGALRTMRQDQRRAD